jgi:hypothetical protein
MSAMSPAPASSASGSPASASSSAAGGAGAPTAPAAGRPAHLQADFKSWVAATSPPEALVLGQPGFTYADLYQPNKLAELTGCFHEFLRERDEAAHSGLMALAAAGGALPTAVETSNALIAASEHLSAFVARLFQVEHEVEALRRSLLAHDPVLAFKREFGRKRVIKADAGKGWSQADAAAIAPLALAAAGVPAELLGAGTEDEEVAVAKATLLLVGIDETARKLSKAGGAEWQHEMGELAERVGIALGRSSRSHWVPSRAGSPTAGPITTTAPTSGPRSASRGSSTTTTWCRCAGPIRSCPICSSAPRATTATARASG